MNSIMKKMPLQKKWLLFMNLDIVDKIATLLKFFIPTLVVGGFIQYLLQQYNYDINIISILICSFVIMVIFLSLPQDNVEIYSNKKICQRYLTIAINLLIGIVYMAITLYIIVKLLTFTENNLNITGDMLFIYRCAWGLIWTILFVWLIIFKYNKKLFFQLKYGEMKGVHVLNIEKETFLRITMRKKNFEFRLADIKRRRIKIGDFLVFRNIDNIDEIITTEVEAVYFADNFNELMLKMPQNKELTTNFDFLNKQFPLNCQKKRKVIAIKFKI